MTIEVARLSRSVRRAARAALDLVLPPRCLACGALVESPGALCASCFNRITFVGAPSCAACGLPFELEDAAGGGETLCGACAAKRPPYDRARAALIYDDASRELILRFKHADRTDAAPAFARWMMRAGGDLVASADVIVPVPLHRWRLFRRRYNQAALIALHLGRLSGVAVAPGLLVRRKRTASQGVFDRAGRFRNVRGAFAARRPGAVRGKAVVLVDDVMTTGATVEACARALKAAGASSVAVLTVARVV